MAGEGATGLLGERAAGLENAGAVQQEPDQAARQLDRAESYASDARKMAMSSLGMRRIDADPWLPTAVGAAIEVHASVLAARGEVPEALAYLREQLKSWNGTSLEERISKNINLLKG